MKILQKYWLRIVWLLVWGFLIFYFDFAQKEHYLSSDTERFTKNSHTLLILIEVVLLIAFVVWNLARTRQLRPDWRVVAALVVFLPIIYLFFHDVFTEIGLYINRQSSRDVVTRSYVTYYMDKDKSAEFNISLVDVGEKHTRHNDSLTAAVYRSGADEGDTVKVDFKRGVLGVVYFDRLLVKKNNDHRNHISR